MDCCNCEGVETAFDRKKAAKKLARYRKKGPQNTTRLLVGALKAQGVQGKTVLDIGGGIGAIQHDLLQAGSRHAVNLEASTGYLEACAEEAERQGHADRITHLHGDFAHMNDVPPADIVTLERVICCYPDYERLVQQSCEKANEMIGVVYPHEALWVRVSMEIGYNLKFKLQRSPFRVFLHPPRRIHSLITSAGFTRRYFKITGPWQVYVYTRT